MDYGAQQRYGRCLVHETAPSHCWVHETAPSHCCFITGRRTPLEVLWGAILDKPPAGYEHLLHGVGASLSRKECASPIACIVLAMYD